VTIRLASGGLCNDPSVTQIVGGDGEESSPGILATWIASGIVVQVGTNARLVKVERPQRSEDERS